MTTDKDFVAHFVTLQPDLEHLSNVANPLLLTLLDVPQGVEYLLEQGYLDDEFEYWFENGVFQYSTIVELVLQNPDNCAMYLIFLLQKMSGRPPPSFLCAFYSD